jgi:5'-nucleotidase
LEAFHQHESINVASPLDAGPLKVFLKEIKKLQSIEMAKKNENSDYRTRLHVSLVTARNAPSHERAINTLKQWGLMVNDAFFLGGIDKGPVLGVLRPHIFFDDQPANLASSSTVVPSVHIPLGIVNEPLDLPAIVPAA